MPLHAFVSGFADANPAPRLAPIFLPRPVPNPTHPPDYQTGIFAEGSSSLVVGKTRTGSRDGDEDDEEEEEEDNNDDEVSGFVFLHAHDGVPGRVATAPW